MSNQFPFYLILGMHRSGTSCLTGALECCGLHLGEVQRKSKYNKKGNLEMRQVFKIHDQALTLNKSSWYQPPNSPVKIHPHYQQKLKIVVDELSCKMPCGLKDPRVLLFIDSWKDILDDNYQLIGSFRHPMAVAQSLYTRSKFPIEQGIQLWIAYNIILVEEHKKQRFPLIHFDLSYPKRYRKNIIAMAKKLGLKPNLVKLYFFVSSNLEHHQSNKFQVPSSCRELYDYLLRHKFIVG